MQITIVGLGAICADYFNVMINHAIANKSIRNGLTIMLIFGLFYLLEGLLHYVLSLYCAKHFKINFQYLSHQLLNALKHKDKSFFHKVDSNYFYLIDTAMQSITVFMVLEITSLCSNCILIVVIVGVIGVISP
jgi:ABC-type bacteriocin/lantibiotic exporter with double-glycine peptidase domain